MSADEDTELRDLVAQTLETNGVLGKIRAQIRASVFLALEEQESVQNKSPFLNKELKNFLNTREGRVVGNLVREFLEYFKLDYSVAVFEPESNSREFYEGRKLLARDLDIIESDDTQSQPLLAEVVKRCCSDMGGHRHVHSEDMSPEYLQAARDKFDEYDLDQSGTIEKDELRELFVDIFPDFNRNMLDRYVNDEFRAYDKDFSNSIDFEEFLDMYKRMFVLHKSTVSEDVHELTHTPRSRNNSQTAANNTPPPPHAFRQASPPPPPLPLSPPPQAKQNQTSVEKENQKNLQDTLEKTISEKEHRVSIDSPRDMTGSEADDDSFFDNPPPQNTDGLKINTSSEESPLHRSKIPRKVGFSKDTHNNNNAKNGATKSSGNSFEYEESPRAKTPDTDRSVKDIDKKMSELGLDLPDDNQEYDDEDFESSKVSDLNKTPRSGRSGMKSGRSDSTVQSIEEDIDDFEDELSGADDLLHSNSQKDDLTTDRTVSPHDQIEAFDYVEEIKP